MKILITGVNGFIGQQLAEALLQRNHTVIGLGRNAATKITNLSKYYSGSVLDKKILKKAATNVEVIVHLAALTSHKDIIENRFKTLEVNLEGTKNVLDVFSKSNTAKKFIYSSTGKVYGKIKKLPITETHPTEPLNILGKSKLIAEKLIDFYNDKEKEIIIFRIFNIYGPKQKENFLVPTILQQLNKDEITLGDIDAKRDYVHIDDLIEALILAIEKKNKMGVSIYNICTGKATSASEIVGIIGNLLGKKITINRNKLLIRHDEMKDEFGSYRKVKSALGWSPKTTLQQGLKELINK